MNTNSLSYKTLKNVSYNMIGFFWPLIFSIFVTPIIVLKLGVERYGVMMLVVSISSLMGLFDLGIGSTLVKYLSEYNAKGENQKVRDLVYTFNILLLGLAFLGLIFLSLIGYWAHIFFPSDIVSADYYFTIFTLSGFIFFINTISATYTVVPVVMQRFDISTKLGLVNMTLSNLTILVLVLEGFSLKAVFLCQLIFAFLMFFFHRYYSNRLLPIVKMKYAWVRSEVVNVYKFGITTYMSNAANSALTYFDRLLIPIFLGPAALSYYSVPGNITTKTPGLINNVATVVFPVISNLNGINNKEKIRSIYIRVFDLISVVTFAITISIIIFANKILLYWLNADFADKSTGVLILLAITYYFLTLAGTLNSFLLGLSKTKFLFLSSFFMALLNVILLFFLLPRFGIVGAAWAYLLSVLPIVYMFHYTEKVFLNLEGRLLNHIYFYAKLFFVGAIFYLFTYFLIIPLVTNLRTVIILGPASVVLYLFMYRAFGFFKKEDIDLMKSYMNVLFRKFKSINF